MKSSTSKKVAVGAGLGLLAAAGAAAYFFTGKDGAKNRAKAKAWAGKAKKEVVAELKKLEKVSQKAYHTTVDTVMDKYQQLKDIDPEDLKNVAKELKSHWKSISAHMGDAAKKAEKTVKSTAQTVAKKVKKAVK